MPFAPRRRLAAPERRPVLVIVLASTLLLNGTGWPLPSGGEAFAGEADSSAAHSGFVSHHRKTLLITTGAGAAASGLAAMLYRRAANDRFEEYQHTADPDRLRDLYDQSSRLDNRAAACFIAAEGLFVLAIYFGFFVHPARAATNAGAASTEPGRSLPTPIWMPERGLGVRWSF